MEYKKYQNPPLLKHFNLEIEQLPFRLLPPAHHLDQGDALTKVALQFEHFLVADLVILAVLARLHLFGPLPERHVGVAGGRARALLALHLP